MVHIAEAKWKYDNSIENGISFSLHTLHLICIAVYAFKIWWFKLIHKWNNHPKWTSKKKKLE